MVKSEINQSTSIQMWNEFMTTMTTTTTTETTIDSTLADFFETTVISVISDCNQCTTSNIINITTDSNSNHNIFNYSTGTLKDCWCFISLIIFMIISTLFVIYTIKLYEQVQKQTRNDQKTYRHQSLRIKQWQNNYII